MNNDNRILRCLAQFLLLQRCHTWTALFRVMVLPITFVVLSCF